MVDDMIFLILKIIGIILLAVLLILCMLIFLPWHLRLNSEVDNLDSSAAGSVSSGIYFFRLKAFYNEDFSFRAYIFWGLIKIFDSSDKKKHKNHKEKENQKNNKVRKKNNQEKESHIDRTDENINETCNKNSGSINKSNEDKKSESINKYNADKKSKKKVDSKDKKNIFSKIKEFITIITGKKEKKALRKLIRLIKNLLRHFRVKVYKTKLTYALGEPDLTGIATGVISWIPIVYSDGASIFPDFTADEAFVRGHIRVKGSIMLLWVLIFIFNIFTDKDIKKIATKIGG